MKCYRRGVTFGYFDLFDDPRDPWLTHLTLPSSLFHFPSLSDCTPLSIIPPSLSFYHVFYHSVLLFSFYILTSTFFYVCAHPLTLDFILLPLIYLFFIFYLFSCFLRHLVFTCTYPVIITTAFVLFFHPFLSISSLFSFPCHLSFFLFLHLFFLSFSLPYSPLSLFSPSFFS